MSAADVVVLVAAVVASRGRHRRSHGRRSSWWARSGGSSEGSRPCRGEALALLDEANQAAHHASVEMARVEAVLEDTESVTATVDSATKLAQRAFANPVVKVLAFRAGASSGMRKMREPG